MSKTEDEMIPAADAQSLSDVSPPEHSAATVTGAAVAYESAARPRGVGYYRWVICALLFFATTVNYVDRAVFGVLGQTLRDQFGWTATQFGDINAAFTLAYAIGFLFVGWFIDKVGTRWGYTICLIVWSIAAASQAALATPPSLSSPTLLIPNTKRRMSRVFLQDHKKSGRFQDGSQRRNRINFVGCLHRQLSVSSLQWTHAV